VHPTRVGWQVGAALSAEIHSLAGELPADCAAHLSCECNVNNHGDVYLLALLLTRQRLQSEWLVVCCSKHQAHVAPSNLACTERCSALVPCW
jgi:hypothetical protein